MSSDSDDSFSDSSQGGYELTVDDEDSIEITGDTLGILLEALGGEAGEGGSEELRAAVTRFLQRLQSARPSGDADEEEFALPEELEQVGRDEVAKRRAEQADALAQSELGHRIRRHCRLGDDLVPRVSPSSLLRGRELGGQDAWAEPALASCHVPCEPSGAVDMYGAQAFCGEYSDSGRLFMTASQDNHLRLYDTATWTMTKDYHCDDVGWSILSVDYSPDEQWVVYSTWSEHVHLFSATSDSNRTESLDVCGDIHGMGRVCLFSTHFSPDSTEILAGSSDRHVYVYNLERNEREIRIHAHDDDVNAVAWADESRSVFFSASDDTTIKVWDRRCLTNDNVPAGVLTGHVEGITYLHSLGDGVHLLSNGKDQRAKLWDVRRMATSDVHGRGFRTSFDYRYGARRGGGGAYGVGGPGEETLVVRHRHDLSVQTYSGHHSTYRTLLRAKVSPTATTDQRFVAVASHDGAVTIYDLLTGQLVSKNVGHEVLVRDVSWHPHRQELVTTSWDGACVLWNATGAEHGSLARRKKDRTYARYGFSVSNEQGVDGESDDEVMWRGN